MRALSAKPLNRFHFSETAASQLVPPPFQKRRRSASNATRTPTCGSSEDFAASACTRASDAARLRLARFRAVLDRLLLVVRRVRSRAGRGARARCRGRGAYRAAAPARRSARRGPRRGRWPAGCAALPRRPGVPGWRARPRRWTCPPSRTDVGALADRPRPSAAPRAPSSGSRPPAPRRSRRGPPPAITSISARRVSSPVIFLASSAERTACRVCPAS